MPTPIDELTNEELATAIAEMMGCQKIFAELTWFWEFPDKSLVRIADWNPYSSWADFGVVVEWMEAEPRGWESEHYSWGHEGADWYWWDFRSSPIRKVYATDPDIRTASLKAGLKAQGGDGEKVDA